MAKMSDYLKNLFFIIILLQVAPPLLRNIVHQYSRILEPQTKAAYLELTGVLYNSDFYTRHLRSYFEQSDIKAIVLKIETPGSAAGTAETIAHEIELLQQEYPKPIVTIVENICTSGGYYIASTTDYIISAPSALIGSIGTAIPYQFKVNELLKKYDISYVPVTAGTYKGTTDPFRPATEKGTEMLQSVADDSYQQFKEHVIKHRSQLSLKNVQQWGEAQIFTGRQAKELGLIDEIGSKTTIITKIKELAIIEGEIEWIKPSKPTGLAALFGQDETTGLQTLLYNLHEIVYRISDLLIK